MPTLTQSSISTVSTLTKGLESVNRVNLVHVDSIQSFSGSVDINMELKRGRSYGWGYFRLNIFCLEFPNLGGEFRSKNFGSEVL